jgi:hypothetical protein
MSPLARTLIGASIPFVLVVLYVISLQQPRNPSIPSLDIGIEHAATMTLSMTITQNDTQRMLDISNDTVEPIAVSVPTDWKRGEVRNVPLASVTADAPSFGYVRWHLPKDASVSFGTNHPFEHLNLHNPSGVPLKINAILVDLQKNTGDHQVYLVKEGAVMIP